MLCSIDSYRLGFFCFFALLSIPATGKMCLRDRSTENLTYAVLRYIQLTIRCAEIELPIKCAVSPTHSTLTASQAAVALTP